MACIWESWKLATSRRSDFHTVGSSALALSIQHPALLGQHKTCCQQHDKHRDTAAGELEKQSAFLHTHTGSCACT